MGRARREAAAAARGRRVRGAPDPLNDRAFAGAYAARGDARAHDLERALEPDGGAAARADRGALSAAWTGADVADGSPMCVVDGRIRTEALATEIGLEPSTPAERVVAEAYALIGDALLGRLSGEFALLVWSEEEGRGLLARDRSGARPLFLAARGETLLFASEVRNLLRLLPGRPEPDEPAMAHWLARVPAPGDRTLFAGVERLAGGAAVRLGPAGRWEVFRHWSPRPQRPLEVDAPEAAALVREAIGGAVERALEGAQRPGVMLSGGLDSASIAAIAAHRSPTAYSGVFPDLPAVDESDRIRGVRAALGIEGVEAELGSGSALAAAAEFTRAWELPPASPNRFVWAPLLERAAGDGVDVLLDGEGGDELFGCARYLVADRLRRGRPVAALRTARRLPGMGDRPRPRWIARAVATYGLRGALPLALHERLRTARGSAGGPDWLMVPVADGRWSWKQRPGPRWWAQLASVLAADSLGAADHQRREAALHGLDLRHPLRDPELVDLALRLPPDLGFDPHLDRPLMRRAMAAELPRDVLTGTAKPFFNTLLERALAGPDHAALRHLVDDLDPALARLVTRAAVRTMAGNPRGTAALGLWRVATLQLWLAHRDGSS